MVKYALRELVAVGNTFKTIGIKGEIIAEMRGFDQSKAALCEYLFVEHNGQSVPYFLTSIVEGDTEYFTLKFEGIDDPESAQALTQKTLYLDKSALEDIAIDPIHQVQGIAGLVLWNKRRSFGEISEVVQFPSQLMLKLREHTEVLIPLVEEWIVDLDFNDKKLVMDFPEGLINLEASGEEE